MASESNEFSFHEMENIKRRLADTPAPSSDEGPDTIPAVPHPGLRDEFATTPQELFSRSSNINSEALQLKRVLRVFQRHWAQIFFITLAFPVIMWLYDDVMNRPGMPDWVQKIGAIKQYAAQTEVLQQQLPATPGSFRLPFFTDYNINQILNRRQFKDMYLKWLEENKINEMKLSRQPADKIASLERYVKNKRGAFGVRISSSAISDNQFTLQVNGTDQDLLPVLSNQVVPVLNAYFRNIRQGFIQRTLDLYLERQRKNQTTLEEALSELSRIDHELSGKDPGRIRALAMRERLESEHYKTHMALERIKIKADIFRKTEGFRKVAKKFSLDKIDDIEHALVDGNSLRQDWKDLESKLRKALIRYTPEHPLVIRLNQDVKAIMAEIRERGGINSSGELPPIPSDAEIQIMLKIRQFYQEKQIREQELAVVKKQLDEAKLLEEKHLKSVGANKDVEMFRERNLARTKVANLQAQAITNNNKVAELQITKDTISSEVHFKIVKDAGNKGYLIRPNTKLDVGLAFVVGLILSLGVIFLFENMDSKFHTPSDVYYHLQLNYLGIIPFYTEKESVRIDPNRPDSQHAEVYAHLCNNIRYGQGDQPERCLLIASATQGEGKSTIISNLAIRYALEGNSTLLVDADLRRPRGEKILGDFQEEGGVSEGLSEYLEGKQEWAGLVRKTIIPGLQFIAAGARVRNPAKLLGSANMLRLLDLAQKQYDILLIDCPAVLPVVDATILAPHVRGVLMVVAAEEVEIGAVRTAMYRLRHVNAKVVGAVLNKVRERSTSYTYYGYRYKKGYYYNPYGPPLEQSESSS